jgi:hypothetical protein
MSLPLATVSIVDPLLAGGFEGLIVLVPTARFGEEFNG